MPSSINKSDDVEPDEIETVYSAPLERTLPPLLNNERLHVRISETFGRSVDPTESSALLQAHPPIIMGEKFNDKITHVVKGRSIIVDILVMFFGFGPWAGVNGTFMQLPLLVETAPEAWALPSYITIMVQIGNLGPITYTLLQRFLKNKPNDTNIIYGLLATGPIWALLVAFLYKKTAVVFGEEHSIALFILTVFTAFCACTSSVLCMPYMGRFKEVYLVTYYVGEGLSGLLPSILALIQGIGGPAECRLVGTNETTGEEIYEKYQAPPRFGTMTFFLLLFPLLLCSCIGFTLLNRLQLAKRQYAAVQVANGNSYVYEREQRPEVDDSVNQQVEGSLNPALVNSDLAPEITSCQYRTLLILIFVISFFASGFFNGIDSYSSLPYGSKAYHLSVVLSVIASPLAYVLAAFLPHTSLRSIGVLSVVLGILSVYVLVTASMSPLPPLVGTTLGSVIVIITWILINGIYCFVKICITAIMRSQGGRSLVWIGGLQQAGAAIGSVAIFVLVNFTKVFTEAEEDDC